MYKSVWLLVMVVAVALANPDGPPTGANPQLCETMLPGHGATTASGKVPFAISLNADKYEKAKSIDVSVYAKDAAAPFRGFFVQARRVGGPTYDAVGSFISEPADGTQFIECGTHNSAWGHADRNKKTRVTATWMGPSTDIGPLLFNATVVGLSKEEYWTEVLSAEITFGSANGVRSQGMLLSAMVLLAYVVRK
ncbi:putative defense protein Hdd11-like [Patiria miniata]|uniref:Reelin domain-containing protein n=1 Tax=Patiria miniata TaxID=46514 RepID=A0A914AYN8_PATMI|nr:putative defense protein Hdd11-like [Patiria miniata]